MRLHSPIRHARRRCAVRWAVAGPVGSGR